jgi:hypothetical protein
MLVEICKDIKSPGMDQIPAKLIQAGRETLRSEIHKHLLILLELGGGTRGSVIS